MSGREKKLLRHEKRRSVDMIDLSVGQMFFGIQKHRTFARI